jgi:putative transposase
VDCIVSRHDLNLRRACRFMKQSRSVQYYQGVEDPKQALRGRMREIAQIRLRYGYRRIHVLLKREGWEQGKNPAYRLYRPCMPLIYSFTSFHFAAARHTASRKVGALVLMS